MKILVTGGTNGMGLGTARSLAALPDTEVIVLGRSVERGAAVVQELSALASPERISFVACDLARLADVDRAIDTIRSTHDRLDGIFVNAGLGYAATRVVTEDGMDSHFQVNYLAQFMLTLNLLELLERSEHGGRVVFNATEFGELDFDDLQSEQTWGYEAAIFKGMAAKRMFYEQLHAIYAEREPAVSCFGFRIHKTVWSNQLAIIPWPMRAMATVARCFGQFITLDQCGDVIAPLFAERREQSLERSGRLITWKGGTYCEFEGAKPTDPADREQLWRHSVELCDHEPTTEIATNLRR